MIDLHIHTEHSDGTDSVEKIVRKVISKNLTCFSITDHDMVDGVKCLRENAELMDLLNKYGVNFINGVEFSGFIDDSKIHILGYNFDIENSDLLDVIALGKKKRFEKYQVRLEALAKQKGIIFSKESIEEMDSIDYIGNPIMSIYLVKDGIFATRDDAMKCINSLVVPNSDINVDAHIIMPAIINAGGTIVWAHPLGGLNEPRITFEKVEEIVKKLIPLGLKGLECYYNLYSFDEIERLVDIANRYHLFISAGSDYHGKNKDADIGEVANRDNYEADDFATILDILS